MYFFFLVHAAADSRSERTRDKGPVTADTSSIAVTTHLPMSKPDRHLSCFVATLTNWAVSFSFRFCCRGIKSIEVWVRSIALSLLCFSKPLGCSDSAFATTLALPILRCRCQIVAFSKENVSLLLLVPASKGDISVRHDYLARLSSFFFCRRGQAGDRVFLLL